MRLFLKVVMFWISAVVLVTAQDAPAVKWGEQFKELSNSFLSKIVATGAEGFYTLRVRPASTLERRKVFLEYYSDAMNLKKARELQLKYKGKRREFQDVVMLGQQLYLITSFHNEAKHKNYLFRQKIHNTRLTTSDHDLELISEIDTRSIVREGTFDLVQSRDSSKLLIYNKIPTKKNEAEQFNLRVYNDDFALLWDRDITLPYDDRVFRVEEYRVDGRTGNVYVLGLVYKNGVRDSRNGQANYEHVILTYTNEGVRTNEYRISIDDIFITDLTFRVARNGDLICSGFYSDRSRQTMRGTYFFRLNAATKEIYNQNLKEFDFDFITSDYNIGRLKRAERAEAAGDEMRTPELYRFALDDLILRSDGGAILVAEQFFIREYTRNLGNGGGIGTVGGFNNFQQTDYYYNYNDIIVVNIRPDGSIQWATRIPKRQETRNDGGYFSSYAMSIVRDKLYFVYNDNLKNLLADTPRIRNFIGKNSVVVLSQIDKKGELKTIPLFQSREFNLVTRPKVCRQIGRKSMVIYSEWRNRFRFAEINF